MLCLGGRFASGPGQRSDGVTVSRVVLGGRPRAHGVRLVGPLHGAPYRAPPWRNAYHGEPAAVSGRGSTTPVAFSASTFFSRALAAVPLSVTAQQT